jgi:hypothetical protein
MYNTKLIVSYSNDLEYRKNMRELFSMNHKDQCDNIDDITNDENNYDHDSSSKSLDFIYKQTRNNIYFKSIYDLAASKMFSMDREIGLAVLFSYDNMDSFHKCLCSFLENKRDFNDTNEHYMRMYEKIK